MAATRRLLAPVGRIKYWTVDDEAMRWRTLLALFAPLVVASLWAPPASGEHADERCMLDISMVMDRSGSMNGPPSIAARAGASRLLDLLDDTRDQSGVRGFSGTTLDKGLDFDHNATKVGVNAPGGAGGGTQLSATYESLDDIRDGARFGTVRVIIVFSDGVNGATDAAADDAKAIGVRMVSVATGTSINRAHMQRIASEPLAANYYEASTEQEAKAAMDRLIASLLSCPPPISFTVSKFCENGVTEVTLTLVGGDDPIRPATGDATWSFDDGHPDITAAREEPVQREARQSFGVTVTLTVPGGTFSMTHTAEASVCQPPEVAIQCSNIADRPGWIRVLSADTPGEGAIVHAEWVSGPDPDAPPAVDLRLGASAIVVERHVVDEWGQEATASTWCRGEPNRPPIITAYNETVRPGQEARVFLWAHDERPESLTWALDLAAFPGAFFDGTYLYWTPGPGAAGIYGPARIAVDDGDLSSEVFFWIHVVVPPPAVRDQDGDGVVDEADNCPAIPNHGQADRDGDEDGDACDEDGAQQRTSGLHAVLDADGDGLVDSVDNCPGIQNIGQRDMDFDGLGDACDADMDGDRIPNALDVCPWVPDPDQRDADADGTGDACLASPASQDPPTPSCVACPEVDPVDTARDAASSATVGFGPAAVLAAMAGILIAAVAAGFLLTRR